MLARKILNSASSEEDIAELAVAEQTNPQDRYDLDERGERLHGLLTQALSEFPDKIGWIEFEMQRLYRTLKEHS
jgi:hypothetical protein